MSDLNDKAIDDLHLAAKQCDQEGKGLVELLLWRGRRIDELYAKYSELIMAVAQKSPDESRHETALRYIQQRESTCYGPEQTEKSE